MRLTVAIGLVLSCLVMISSPASSAETTILAMKATGLQKGMTRDEVIGILGQATWAIIPGDKGGFALPDKKLSLDLRWKNPGCAPVVVLFNRKGKAIEWDAGRTLCGKDAHIFEPPEAYSCDKEDRKHLCR